MKSRPTQFGPRENTAFPRQHVSRLAVDVRSNTARIEEVHATTGEREGKRGQLLTVQEVAKVLHVPTSWVYERTRRRRGDQLPHLKLGKYLRFEEAAITEFIKRQRCA
jgi:excisionase family DNA binding protein